MPVWVWCMRSMIKYLDTFTRKRLDDIRYLLKQKCEYNMFEHLIKLLELSKNKYGIKLTKYGGKIKNLNRLEDERLTKLGVKKTKTFLPPDGLDAYVEVDVFLDYVDQETESHAVSIINIIFHELFEAYMMADVELQYNEAHNYAGVQEKILVNQIPGMTQWYAYEKLKNITKYT